MKKKITTCILAFILVANIIGINALAEDVIFCSNCGKKIAADSKFCNYCGAEVKLLDDSEEGSSEKDASMEKSGETGKWDPFSEASKIKGAIAAATEQASKETDSPEKESKPFDEQLLYDNGYKRNEDEFTGQKIFLKLTDGLVKLNYNTDTLTYSDRIFGKKAAERSYLVALNEGDKSTDHSKQLDVHFYPTIVYHPEHKVPYSFVVSISFPRVGNFGFFNAKALTISTDNAIYNLECFLSAENTWYHNVAFITVNEESIKMFEDIKEAGKFAIRADVFSESSHDFRLSASIIDDVLETWEIYVQAGGTNQDLSLYNKMITVKTR